MTSGTLLPQKTSHIPVLLAEVLSALQVGPGVFVDATFGAGGYSRAILQVHPKAKVYAFDRDETVLPFVKKLQTEFPNRFHFTLAPFADLGQYITFPIDGIVWDLGVSSMQIDNPQRGFSFMQEGPLDMRMSSLGLSAKDVVNTFPEEKLADILYTYGEERASFRIARALIKAREKTPIETTGQLADIIHHVMPHPKKGDSAMRSFQALRIYVNDELGQLQASLNAGLQLLAPGGRMVAVTFHSLEDRIVKTFYAKACGKGAGQNRHQITQESLISPQLKDVLKKPIVPTEEEILANPRAHSAKLRWAIKV